MKQTGVRSGLLATGGVAALMFGGLFASPAGALEDTGTFQDKDYKVSGQPSFDSNTGQTTFTITLEGTEAASHVTVVPCGSPKLVSATGPQGSGKVENGEDGSTGHTGTKFEKGATGTYTLVYEGNVAGLDFIVKNGSGHKHFAVGSCTTETTTPSTPTEQTPPSENPPAENPPANNPPAENPSSNPASNQPGQTGTEVQGATQTKPAAPSTDVLGSQESQPEVQGTTLPRTGGEFGLLGQMGAMFVAFGGIALAAGRRRSA